MTTAEIIKKYEKQEKKLPTNGVGLALLKAANK